MAKLYIYKMTTDDGGAPCVYDGTLSLAICKPAIRSTAEEGSTILAFAANALHRNNAYRNNALVYAARVTKRLEDGTYFTSARYKKRPDCVYEMVGERFQWRPGAKFHGPKNLRHDLGNAPDYKRANVLLSHGANNFRYFGGDCTLDYKTRFPNLKLLVETLGQGHRVNLSSALRSEIEALVSEVFRMKSPHTSTPVPKESCGHTCSREDDCYRTIDC